MNLPTSRDAADASQAIERFWAALSNDDDPELLRVTFRAVRDEVGTEPGMCGRVRELLGVTSEECRTVGTSSKVRVVPDGRMVFLCVKLEDGEPTLLGSWGPEQVIAWGLTVEMQDGLWRVSGRYDDEQWPAGTHYIDLPWAPPAGPTH